MDKTARMRELIPVLREASRAYYQESREIMTNEQYDRLYDELVRLEKETGTVLAGSPTAFVGYEVVSALPREAHETPALSLDKTKDVAALADFLGDHEGLLSWKLDGLTIVLTYEGGVLQKAVTRGNGEIGEVVTGNARTFVNLPARIPYTGKLILRGEAVIRYSDFERLNAELDDEDAKYKNPRNLCSGSVRQLDASVTAARSVNLVAFALIDAPGVDFEDSMEKQLEFLDAQGFETVERIRVNRETAADAVKQFSERILHYDIPSDGLVLTLDELSYGASLGRTAKFPRNAIAFKWQDEMAETTLRNIEWSASRTGLINPVAVFDPVELEGTSVSRASVHNISIVEELALGIGDTVRVYKANMIIPQIAENLTKSGTAPVPDTCPVCGAPTEVHENNGVKTLHCTNPDCPARQIKRFDLFASRNALKIDGLSESTMEKLIDRGFIRTLPDLFRLQRHKAEITEMEGFGEKSFENLTAAVDRARNTTLTRLITGLGIPEIGTAGARLLARRFKTIGALRSSSLEDLTAIDGIGEKMAVGIRAFFTDDKKMEELDALLTELTVEEEQAEETVSSAIAGKTFVITGAVHHFENRDALKAFIEERGGHAAGSVSKNTDYLINNDVNSTSSKNKKARELGIPILSEEDFLKIAEDTSGDA